MKFSEIKNNYSIQHQLNSLYMQYLHDLYQKTELLDSIDRYEISSPLFLSVDTERGNYLNASTKLLFIGKETNGWFNPTERKSTNLTSIKDKKEEYLKALVDHYRRFNMGEQWNSPLFQFLSIVNNKFKQKTDPGYLLTELIRHDYLCKGVPFDIFQKIDFQKNHILRKEIEILSPNILIFLTGPSYDWFITNTFADAQIRATQNGEYSINQVAIIEGIPKTEYAFRIYHPDYHNRISADFKYDMADLLFNKIYG